MLIDQYDGGTLAENDCNISSLKREEYKKLKATAEEIFQKIKTNGYKKVSKEEYPNQYVLIAPFYHIDVADVKKAHEVLNKYRDEFLRSISDILRVFKIKFEYRKMMGIYNNESGLTVREPSLIISLGKIEQKCADLIASLLADLSFQQQESTIIFNGVSQLEWDNLKMENQAFAYRCFLRNIDIPEFVQSCYKHNAECSISESKLVSFIRNKYYDFSTNGVYNPALQKEFENSLQTRYDIMHKLDLTKNVIERLLINERFLDVKARKIIYKIN